MQIFIVISNHKRIEEFPKFQMWEQLLLLQQFGHTIIERAIDLFVLRLFYQKMNPAKIKTLSKKINLCQLNVFFDTKNSHL
jgi:hypothetical protein